MKSILRNTVLSICLAIGLGSCSDFFDLLPLNEIVLESYYTEENDITSVINSCYAGLQSSDCLRRMAVWGEFRSDNISEGSGTSNDDVQLLRENILATTDYADWASFYNVINRCNTVLYYAPLVQQRDPNYTVSELRANVAEVKALRALCYFYLIRTYRDVPFVVEPSINDDVQKYRIAATPFDSIITFLVTDLEAVKNDAVRRYADKSANTARMTRTGIHALLADLYLWKGDYAASVENCDLVIEAKHQQYKEEVALYGNNTDVELFKEYPLISQQASGSTRSGNTSTRIFGEGNSFESIFELNFITNQQVSNGLIGSYYGSNNTRVGSVSATPFLAENVATGANKLFKNTDCRYLEFMEKSNTQYGITKYTRVSNVFDSPLASSAVSPTVTAQRRTDNFANWIIYRFTDVLLMKAEAQLQLGKTMVNDTVAPATTMKPYMQSAFRLVSAVYNRSNNLTNLSADTLKYADYAVTVGTMEDLVLNERQRELMFEGKRWFDLVRMARRQGTNATLINHVIKKQKSNTNAIRIQLGSPDGLYFPYKEEELKLNPQLKQNPAYEKDQSSTISE